MFRRRKFGGAIGYFKLDKFWSELNEEEKQMTKQAGNIDTLDSGIFSIPFKLYNQKKILLNTPIDYFSGILSNLVLESNREKAELFIKWYEYLTKKFLKVNDIWALYFFHMSAMKAYKTLEDIPKAVEAAKNNLMIAKKLSKEIKKDHLYNPCYEFLYYYWSKKNPNEKQIKWLEKIGRKCGQIKS